MRDGAGADGPGAKNPCRYWAVPDLAGARRGAGLGAAPPLFNKAAGDAAEPPWLPCRLKSIVGLIVKSAAAIRSPSKLLPARISPDCACAHACITLFIARQRSTITKHAPGLRAAAFAPSLYEADEVFGLDRQGCRVPDSTLFSAASRAPR